MRLGSTLLISLTALYLVLPVMGLLTQTELGQLERVLTTQSIWPALRLSLFSALLSTATVVALGTPFAWWISVRYRARPPLGVQLLILWPLVIPPSVLGLALLDTYGNQGILKLNLAFTPAALFLVQTIVAVPLYLQAAISSFSRGNDAHIDVARTLGASQTMIARDIVWPLHRWALLGGASLAFARALGEFGATLIFAGNLPGSTQTAPLAIYEFLEADLGSARVLALLLLGVGCFLIAAAYQLQPRSRP